MSGCIIQCQWRFSSRRMDIELQADRPVHTEKTIQAHVLQRCKELKYTEKNNNCFVFVFFQCGGTLCNRLKLGIHRAERWFETKAAVEKKKKIKNGVWPLQGHTDVLLNRSCYSSRIRSQHFIFIAVMFNQLPWELGHPSFFFSSRLSISILHSGPPLLSPTQRGLLWDVNHAVN